MVNALMTQVISSAVQRCLDPLQLDKAVRNIPLNNMTMKPFFRTCSLPCSAALLVVSQFMFIGFGLFGSNNSLQQVIEDICKRALPPNYLN